MQNTPNPTPPANKRNGLGNKLYPTVGSQEKGDGSNKGVRTSVVEYIPGILPTRRNPNSPIISQPISQTNNPVPLKPGSVSLNDYRRNPPETVKRHPILDSYYQDESNNPLIPIESRTTPTITAEMAEKMLNSKRKGLR